MQTPTSDPTAYARALAQPRFLRALRAAYDGEDDLLDALWWLDHPLQPGPSGAESPAAAVAAARRAFYAREVPPAAHERLRTAIERERTVRSATAAALMRAAPPDPHPRGPAAFIPSAATAEPPPTRGVRLVGRPEHVFRRSDQQDEEAQQDRQVRRPRIVALLRAPRATLYAVDFLLDEVCLLLVADESSHEFRGDSVPTATFERQGIALDLDLDLALEVGLARTEWLPSGELHWWSPDDPRFASGAWMSEV